MRKGLRWPFGGLFIVIFFAVCAWTHCLAEVTDVPVPELRIGWVEVSGNVTISRGDILSAVRSRVGNIFDRNNASEDAQRIAKTEGIEKVWYDTREEEGKIRLVFVIVEKNLVRNITFRGNKNISNSKLIEESGLKLGDYLDVFAVSRGAEKIKELYLRRGYHLSKVSVDQEPLSKGEVVFDIEQGPRCRVRKIHFGGNRHISDRELAKVIKTKTRTFLFWSFWYQQAVMENDAGRLLEAYQGRGFLDCSIQSRPVFGGDVRYVDVEYDIKEGPIYVIGKVVVGGNEFFPVERLTEGLRLRPGRYYSPQYAQADIKKIGDYYLEEGFLNVKVEHKRTVEDPSHVTVEFDISEGERFRLGRIFISGNDYVQDRVIRRVLDEYNFTPGRWYNAQTARGDGSGYLEKLVRQSVLAESISVQPAGQEPGTRDAQVNIVEGRTGMILVGGGIGSDTGLMGQIVYDQRNFDISDVPGSFREMILGRKFRGAGQRFRISLSPGTVQDSFAVSFSEPYLYDKPVALDVSLSSFKRWRDSYDEKRLKGYLGFTKRYNDRWRRGIAFRAEDVKVGSLDPDAPKEVVDNKGSNNLLGVKLFIRKDTTNDIYTPSAGGLFDADYEQVVGDYTFGVLTATQRWYKTLHEDLAQRRTVLETKIFGGTVLGDAPVFEKFYAGGIGTLRGFEYRGVSPRGVSPLDPLVRKDPIGSDWMITGSAEVSVPLTTEVFSALFFVDAGMIDTGGPRVSVGTGIQILIPQWFGPVPMRFALAVPVMKEKEDDTQLFNFYVGALF